MATTRPQFDVPAPAPPKDPLEGMVLGDYVIDKAIGAGGMGIVYAAFQPALKRKVAVKVLRPEHAQNDDQKNRFRSEAHAISAIHHRGILGVHNLGELPDGRQYMVMEFLEGETLEETLRKEAPMPPNRALPIVDEVLDALSAAHRVGVVHRDLKPSNVFMTMQSNGTTYAKLVDFGLAKQSVFGGGGGRQAKASMIAGTPEYISPEQARELQVTPATDLYCLGVMMFEMLSGGLPFAGRNLVEFLRAHIETPAPRLSSYVEVPESLDDLVASLLEKKPEQRPHSADAVRRSIAQILRETREESTQQVARASIKAPLPRYEELQPGMEDTERRSSNPDLDAVPVGKAPTRPGSRPSRPRLDAPKRPSGRGVEAVTRPSQQALEPVRRKADRATGESDRRLSPVAGDAGADERDDPPTVPRGGASTAPVVPAVKAAAVTRPGNGRVIGAVAATVVIASLAGAGAAVLTPSETLPAAELVEHKPLALPPGPAPLPPPAPVPSPFPPEPPKAAATLSEQELKKKLEEAKAKEAAAADESFQRDFYAKMRKVTATGIRKGSEEKGGQEFNQILKAEVDEVDEVKRKREAALTAEQRARDEVARAKGDKFSETCAMTGWKREARTRVDQLLKQKIKALDPDAAGLEGKVAELKDEAKALKDGVAGARGGEACAEILSFIGAW